MSHYIKSFSSKARQVFEYFEFEKEIAKLDESNRLFLVLSKFADIDLHPDAVPNHEMGLIFEDLIRRFNEASNETAGDHFTPREVIRLMVNLLFTPDSQILRTKSVSWPEAGLVAILLFSWFGQAADGAASSQSKKENEMEVKRGGPPDLGWNGDDYAEHLALAVV